MPLDLALEKGVHLIVGDNGAGKTSFLESVYLLATTKSFRTSRISDCCSHGSKNFQVVGEASTEKRTRLRIEWKEGERIRSVNGRVSGLGEYLSVLPIVSWSSGDTDVLVGPPDARRRFIDRGVVGLSSGGIGTISTYRKTLLEKRRLLQSNGRGLEVWNEMLSLSAHNLIELRAKYVERLKTSLKAVLKASDLGLGDLQVSYKTSLKSGREGPSAIMKELMGASKRERVMQLPLLGPHRDDLSIRLSGFAVRQVASAGERKALGIALLLAHAAVLSEVGSEPVYLLDDADTELDVSRLRSLWRVISHRQQVFITSNRPLVWEGLEIDHFWTCGDGQLNAA